jgi:hypothetical protein
MVDFCIKRESSEQRLCAENLLRIDVSILKHGIINDDVKLALPVPSDLADPGP